MADQPRKSRPQSGRAARRRARAAVSGAGGGGGTRWLALATLVLVLLIAVGKLRSRATGEESPPSGTAVEVGTPATRSSPPPPPPPPPLPPPPPPMAPGVVEPLSTPVLDLLVQLEAYRRIVRAGRAVYLDSLLADTDSVLRRWPERPGAPVRIAVVQDSVSARVADAAALVQQAFAAWQAHTAGVTFQFADTSDAEILVRWEDQLDPEVARSGETWVNTRSDGGILRADITIARRDPRGRLLDREATLRILLHEAGHAIGLGHSDNPQDAMFPTPQTARLSDRDRRTVELIYGLPPGSVRGGG
jgi:hypothetical protein